MLKTLAYYGLFVAVSLGVHLAVIVPWRKRDADKPQGNAVAVARIVQEAMAIQTQLAEAAQAAELAAAEIDKAERQMPPPEPAPAPAPQPEPQAQQPEPTPPALAPAGETDERFQNLLAASEAQQRELEELKQQQQEAAKQREAERVEEQKRFQELVKRLEQQDERQRALEQEKAKLEAEARQLADARAKAERERNQAEVEKARLETDRARAEQVAAVARADAETARRRLVEDTAAERARAEADLRRREEALERARAEAVAEAAAERRRREEAERALASQSASAEAKEQELARRLATLDDWQRYTRAAATEPIDIERVPAISLRESLERPQDFLELARFYSMEVVVYPPGRADLLAHVDLGTGAITEIRDTKAFLSRFASWPLRTTGRDWEPLVRRVADKFRRDPATLGCYIVFPHKTAGYFAWKQIEAARASGLDPKTVRKCFGRYLRDASGRWVVEIELIETKDGQQHQVR